MVETIDKMNLHLAKDGIFPVTRDKAGELLKELPASGLLVPGTIQGEGKLNGIPSLFAWQVAIFIARGARPQVARVNVTRLTRRIVSRTDSL